MLTAVTNVSPHLLSQEAILNAHLSPFLAEQASTTTNRIDQIQKRNLNLADEILAQRQELDGLVQSLEAAVQDLGDASEALSQTRFHGVDEDLMKYATIS